VSVAEAYEKRAISVPEFHKLIKISEFVRIRKVVRDTGEATYELHPQGC
jgi:hypothetical protein